LRCGCHEQPHPQFAAAPTGSGILNGLPQPPHMIGAWARTEGTTRTLRPQSHTALTRTPPPEEPWRAAGPRKVRLVSADVAAVWAFSARWRRSIVGRYRRFADGQVRERV
jgi:hypothetical protein